MYKKKPLYRKDKKTGLMTRYYVNSGGEYRWSRNSKKMKNFDGTHLPMNSGKYGLDFTPLYRFLLSKLGEKWDAVHSEICERLPLEHRNNIYHIVVAIEGKSTKTRYLKNKFPECVRVGENTVYSALKVENGILVKVNPNYDPKPLLNCWGHTISFNGKPLKETRTIDEFVTEIHGKK